MKKYQQTTITVNIQKEKKKRNFEIKYFYCLLFSGRRVKQK